MNVELDLQPFGRAIASLEAALAEHARTPQSDVVRDGCIQRFKVLYELSHGALKRYLKAASPNPAEFELLSFRDLIRAGSAQGLLLNEWPRWRDYRDERALCSQGYEESIARNIFAIVPQFLEEARHLHGRMQAELLRKAAD